MTPGNPRYTRSRHSATGYFLPPSTSDHLGFAQIWASVKPRSAPGRRAKAGARPFLPGTEGALEGEFDRLEAVVKLWDGNPAVFSEILGILESLKDPFHAMDLLRDGQVLSLAELFILANLCACVRRIRGLQAQTGIAGWPGTAVPPGLEPVEDLLAPGSQGQPRFYISDAYSPALAETRKMRKQAQEMWQEQMAEQARAVEQSLGIRISETGETAMRKSDHDLIEKARSMPELGETRQTLTHVYFRLIPARAAAKREQELTMLKQRQSEQEAQVLRELSLELRTHLQAMEAASCALGELDFLLSKAELARAMDATRPVIREEPGHTPPSDLMLRDAFHPLVKDEVESRGGKYQRISIELDSTVSVITGPNMGGKTVALSTVGLCVAMAQWGLMVPCSKMEFSLYDFIYFQPGQEQTPGLSSFAAEIVSLKQPLSRMGERGLILLDEVGRGANPSQGRALYAALLQYYMENDKAGSTVLATTHYHGLAAALGVPHWQVKGLATASLDLAGSSGEEAGPGAETKRETWAESDTPARAGTKDGAQAGTGAKPGRHTEPEARAQATAGTRDDIGWLYRHMDYTLQKVGPDTPTPQDALVVAKALGLDAEIIDKALKFHSRGG
ncbi:MAG: MutS-related protein [Bacillota bacterium]